MNFYKWYFLEEGRTPEGMFSWQHILSVTIVLGSFLFLAVMLGKKFKENKKAQFITLLASAIVIDLIQFFKIGYILATANVDSFAKFMDVILGNAPLYLCDMQLFILPLAALTRGRFRNWCMDFVAIWGLLMGFLGTYFAGNIYPSRCVIGHSAFNSLFMHCVAAFAALFIFMCGLNKMEKRDIPFTVGMLLIFMTTALITDYLRVNDEGGHANFMFFFDGNGTPFTLFQNLVHDNKPAYQVIIYLLQSGYMVGFYFAYYGIKKMVEKQKQKKGLQLAEASSED